MISVQVGSLRSIRKLVETLADHESGSEIPWSFLKVETAYESVMPET
jgi:hypothetical protein